MTRRRTKAPRGQAVVELAITMVLLVPLILYTLFLEDLLYYRMENQEPTIVAGMDYTTNDYMKGPLKGIQHLNRLKYCDHTAAYDSYDADYDCNGTVSANVGNDGDPEDDPGMGSLGGSDRGHHQASAAHQCWIAKPDAHQVTCFNNKNGGQFLVSTVPSAAGYMSTDWHKGGVTTCTARLGVMNYMLPVKFMEWFGGRAGSGNKDVSNKGRFRAGQSFTQIEGLSDQDVHDDGKVAGANTWFLREEQFAVLSDPWAFSDIGDVKPQDFAPQTMAQVPGASPGDDQHHPLLDRTGYYYLYYGGSAIQAADGWTQEVDEFVANEATIDGLGDSAVSVPVRYHRELRRQAPRNGGYASGWEDQRAQNTNREDKFPSGWGP